MPRNQYPPSRRLLMQAVLCLVLGASVGLAALVSHQRSRSTRLSGAVYVGPIGLKLPSGWVMQRKNQGTVLFVASEPDTSQKPGRRITIEARRVDPNLSPEEFLQSSGLLSGVIRPMDASANAAEPITIAGMPGIALAVKRPMGWFAFMSPTSFETELFAASVRPSGLAISLRLDCPDDTDPQGDVQTLEDIAGAMDVQDSTSSP